MTDLNINDTVTLGRNIIAFVNDLKGLISSTHRSKTYYLRHLHSQLTEQNTAFQSLAAEYFALISRVRASTQSAQSSEDLLALYDSFMEDRDKIVVPRSDLFGSFKGVERLLSFDAPIDLRPYLDSYKAYLEAVGHFFYDDTSQDGGSFFNDIFRKAYYAFDWKKGGTEIEVDYGNMDKLEGAKLTVIDTIDEAREAMEKARSDVAEKYSYLIGRLGAKL